MFAPLGNPGEKHSHSQCSDSLCREGEWVMTADRNVSEADFSLTGANLQNSLQVSTTCAQDAFCFSCLTLKVGSCVLCPVTWAFFCLFQRDTRLQLRCAGRPSFRQFSLAQPACPFFNLHSSPDLVRLVNACLHHPVHCSPMPALYCCQLVWVRYGTVCPIRVSSDWFSPPGFLYGSFSATGSSPAVLHIKWWKPGFGWCYSPRLIRTGGHPSCWCWISFQDRWRGPSLWCFLPGGGLGVWGGHPVRTVEGKALPKSTSATKRVDSQSFDCSLMMRQVVTWCPGINLTCPRPPVSTFTMILIRMLLETGRTKSACQQPHCDSLLVLGTYTVWLIRPTKKGYQHKTEC